MLKWPFVVPSLLLDQFLLGWKQQQRGVLAKSVLEFSICSCSLLHRGDHTAKVRRGKRHFWGLLPHNANFSGDGFFGFFQPLIWAWFLQVIHHQFIIDTHKTSKDNLISIKMHFLMFPALYLKVKVVGIWQQNVSCSSCYSSCGKQPFQANSTYLPLLILFQNIFADFKTLSFPPLFSMVLASGLYRFYVALLRIELNCHYYSNWFSLNTCKVSTFI